MARERSVDASSTLTRAALVLVGVLVALPVLLVTTTLVVLESRLAAGAASSAAPIAAPEYARTFSMTVLEADRTIQLWVEDLDGQPNFRQTVEAGGAPVSDQVYRAAERTLDTREMDAESDLAWSRLEDVGPDELQLSGLVAGPAAWALQYGPGDHQVQVDGRTLDIIVHSVDSDIPEDVFRLPPGAELTTAE